MGQDVANKEKGGVFNVTKGMQQEFGDARVFSAPIAEDYIARSSQPLSLKSVFQKSVGRESASFTQLNFQVPFKVM